MLIQLLKIFAPLAPPIFPEDEDKTRRAKYANAIAIAFLILVIGFEAFIRIFLHYVSFDFMDAGLLGIVGACVIGLVRLRRGDVRSISIMLVAIIWVASNGMALESFGAKDATYIANFAIVLMAGLLLGWPAALTVTVLSILSGLALGYAEQAGLIQVAAFPIMNYAVTVGIVLLLNAFLIFYLISGLETALKKSRLSVEELGSANAILSFTQSELQNRSSELLEANKQLESRTQKLHGIAEVARTTTAIHNFDQLLPAITSGISQQLGYYHVGLFLLDEEKQYAILRSANTVNGLKMVNRGYRVAVGSISPVGYIAQTGQPRITRHKDDDSMFLGNVDFPETRSQIVLPLGSADNVIGVLDIQSRETNAFNQDDLSILSILSDQVAIAIENALLYEQSQTALREAEVASRQAASQAWKEYGETIQTKGYRYDGIKSEPLKDGKQARRESDSLSIPVQLRDQTIGCLKLRSSDAAREWTDDELSMVRATAERVALALEGARLLDEAQKRASREAFLSDVTAKLGTSFQLDSILRDTVEELGQTLKNSTVTFQLVNPSAPPAPEPYKSNGASTDGNTVE
ncbi:MAG TPA: GAF domain-containing protein [Anaerolineales bacterium]|nr:GAF domain-containing protein [Anaerolineales bacterium]